MILPSLVTSLIVNPRPSRPRPLVPARRSQFINGLSSPLFHFPNSPSHCAAAAKKGMSASLAIRLEENFQWISAPPILSLGVDGRSVFLSHPDDFLTAISVLASLEQAFTNASRIFRHAD